MDLAIWHDKRYAPYKLVTLVAVLRKEGIPAELSLKGTGLCTDSLSRPETLTSVSQYLTVCRNAIRLCNNPEIPFRVGSQIHLSAYGMYGFALVCSLTVRDFFNSAVKYHQLATPIISISWQEENGHATWIFDDRLVSQQSDDLRLFLLEQQFAQHVVHLKDLLGETAAVPLSASFQFSSPRHIALYRRYLGCECAFNQPASKLAYPRSILTLKPPMAFGLTYRILQQTCERILSEASSKTGIASKVNDIIATSPGHAPTMEFVAQGLGMTVRTLHRRLKLEDTSFAHICDEVRSKLAKEYLQTTALSTEDIAELLGFSDVANFRHTFRRLPGLTPRQFRAK